jgi:hypothetical protein
MDEIVISAPLRKCQTCATAKPFTDEFFCRDCSRADGLDPRCRECSKSRKAARRANPPPPRPSVSQRFWSRVNKSGPTLVASLGPCWLWTGKLNKGGYGQFSIGGRAGRCYLTHRVAWLLEHGRWPEPHALHRCDGGSIGCVRASHLYEGTQTQNMRDMWTRGRGHRGERTGSAALRTEDIGEIRRLIASGLTQKAVAAIYRVSHATIGDIARGRTWRHVA